MTNADLYREHVEALDRWLADALERAGRAGLELEGVLFHAGRERSYHRDDQPIPFRADPHFLRYVPLDGPEHVLLARPGRRPLLVRVVPRDFWYETLPLMTSWWQEAVEIEEVAAPDEISRVTGPLDRIAYVGNAPEAAAALGIAADRVEPEALMRPLDWHRATKTRHEVELIAAACGTCAEGHRVARKAFENGASEREIHWAYLAASGSIEHEFRFQPITASDEKIAILHYQNKRLGPAGVGQVFMLDAGTTCEGYCSDITRTWHSPDAPAAVRALIDGVDAMQRDLVGMVTPGRPFLDLHHEAHRRVAMLLREAGVLTASAEEGFDRGLTRTFLPHGLGHHLGLQVHDVGGHQAGPDGGTAPPPPEHAALRNTRPLEPGHVVTIEPGVYFPPVLLDALRASPEAALVDWKVIDELRPWGGVRIEDDVLCTDGAPRDLTRPHIDGPRGPA